MLLWHSAFVNIHIMKVKFHFSKKIDKLSKLTQSQNFKIQDCRFLMFFYEQRQRGDAFDLDPICTFCLFVQNKNAVLFSVCTRALSVTEDSECR